MPLSSVMSAEVAQVYILVAHFGMPVDLTPADLMSDRGAQFTSKLWTAVDVNLEFSFIGWQHATHRLRDYDRGFTAP